MKFETNSKFECSSAQNGSNITAFVLNIGEFDIRICFEFRISIFGFGLKRIFRSGII